MDRLTCFFDNKTAVLRECCTFDRESDKEPDDCISCSEAGRSMRTVPREIPALSMNLKRAAGREITFVKIADAKRVLSL